MIPRHVRQQADQERYAREAGLDQPPKPEPVCECGHTDGWHFDFGQGKCERKGCECVTFREKEQ